MKAPRSSRVRRGLAIVTVLAVVAVAGSAVLVYAGGTSRTATPVPTPTARSSATFSSIPPSASPSPSPSRSIQPTPTPTPDATASPAVDRGVELAGLIQSPGSILGFWAIRAGRLFLSTDGGSSWKASTLPSRGDTGGVLAVSAVDANHIWIAYGGADADGNPLPTTIHRTRDGGFTWDARSVAYEFVQQLLFVDAEHGFMVAAGPQPAGVLRTSDGGDTWTEGAFTGWWNLVASDPSTLWSYSPGGGAMCALCGQPLLKVSRDAGQRWSVVSLPGFVRKTDYYYAGIVGMSFLTPSHGFLAMYGKGAMRVFATSNGGRTWAQVATAPSIVAGFAALDERFWYLYDGWNSEKLLVTEDAGRTWRTQHLQGDLWFADAKHAMRVIENVLFLSADGARTWTSIELPV